MLAAASLTRAQPQAVSALHGKRPPRLLIRGATVVEGVGTPPSGPRDVLIEGNRIAQVGRVATVPEGAVVIDGTGKFVLPGLVNMHGHLHTERGGQPMDANYVLKLWLACGITTVRDVGSNFEFTKSARDRSAAGELAAPRIAVYPFFNAKTPEEARQRVRWFKANGADGLKHLGTYRDVMKAMKEEAAAAGLRTAHHTGVEETNAWDDIAFKTTSIEHWYGIPDAALANGVQAFPPGYNYADEVDRFRYAGRLWREADPGKLANVLDAMVKAGVAWDPTLNIYEASRDVTRAQNLPWFAHYLHPVLGRFFEPSRENHGSYFFNWTTEDEVFWKENYRIWMAALRDFERRGGVITTGEDAGYIYQMYGFGLLRELELHQEAGFHPLQVWKHASHNGARVLGMEDRIGRVRAGWLADLLVVNGNPLANFRILYPMPGQGRIEWTIKDGFAYHSRTLMEDIKAMVAAARTPPARPATR